MGANVDQDEGKKGAPAWLVTFGDMMTLLLCFFVLLLSFSNMETERFKVIAGYLREAFGVQQEHHYTEIPAGNTVVSVEFNPPSPSNAVLFERLVSMTDDLGLEKKVESEIREEGIRVRMEGSLVFRPGSARIEEDALIFLDHVADLITEAGAGAIVEGHTDNVPIQSSVYPSNWELSGARSGAVVRYLASQGVPAHRLEAVAFADTRPLTENLTETGRRKNRRVEILIRTDE